MAYNLSRFYRELPMVSRAAVTFDGNANTGAVGAVPIFTVTGEVLVEKLVAVCDTDLTEAAATATISLGVTGSTTLFIGATTATGIDAGEFWVSTTPTANGILLPAAMQGVVVRQNIIGTVLAQAVNGGKLRFICWWRPLSADGKVA